MQGKNEKLAYLERQLKAFRDDIAAQVAEQDSVSEQDSARAQPFLSAEDKENLVKPLLAYANSTKFYFWPHQHASRALRLAESICQATSFDDISKLLAAELKFYDATQNDLTATHTAEDQAFIRTTTNYAQKYDSGYYKALDNTYFNWYWLQPQNQGNVNIDLRSGYKS